MTTPSPRGNPPTSPWQVEWHASLDSTMTRAAALAAAGAPTGTVVVADFQSEGRGTHGRTWQAPPGTCLMFTVLARPQIRPVQLEHLPGMVAEHLAGALRQTTGLRMTVKAPNDIMVVGKKLCGVLCTSRVTGSNVDWVLCGVGLNTHMTRAQLPMDIATSLRCEGVSPVPEHPELLNVLLGSLNWLLDGCADYAGKPILSRIRD